MLDMQVIVRLQDRGALRLSPANPLPDMREPDNGPEAGSGRVSGGRAEISFQLPPADFDAFRADLARRRR